MKKIIQNFLRKRGIQITRYPQHDSVRRMKLLQHYNIDCLFDIGANEGQYAREMRDLGYRHLIVSFEPLSDAFVKLKANASGDANWQVQHAALGAENTTTQINVAGNSLSSSLLEMKDAHLQCAPESRYIRKEDVEVKKLDSIFDQFCKEGSNVMLKIDTQGFEKNVIDGARNVLPQIKLIQLEMSLVELYVSELLFREMLDFMEGIGFELVSLENGFSNPKTGELLQVDGVFVNCKLRS